MKGLVNGQSSKFLITVGGAVCTAITTYYGTTHWAPVVVTGVTALLTYLVPNKPADPPKP